MKTLYGVLILGVTVGMIMGHPPFLWNQGSGEVYAQPAPSKTKTIIGDLLMVDGDFYIVRGERGEIQIEATPDTKITEEFGYGDRIKAIVFMNDKALRIERAADSDVSGVTINQPTQVTKPPAQGSEEAPSAAKPGISEPQPSQPETKTVIVDLIEIEGEFYIARGDRGEVRIEVTDATTITEEFTFGDRIKAQLLMNDKALRIERAAPGEELGVAVHRATQKSAPTPKAAEAPGKKTPMGKKQAAGRGSMKSTAKQGETRTVEGQILMVDGDFYVLRGELGEIRVERTEKTKVTEEFKFGDRIKATVLKNDKALVIERAP